MAGLRIEADYGEFKREFDRMDVQPESDRLDFTMATVFADAEAKVHVISGALKETGATSSGPDGDRRWAGQMTWGGPSPIRAAATANRRHRPGWVPKRDDLEVLYAWYEARRGGEHDYVRSSDEYDTRFGETVGNMVTG